MKKRTDCDFERKVADSVKSGFPSEEIKNHLNSCADCRETVKIVQFFQMNLASEAQPEKLPTAGFIWWKSQIIKKRRAAERTVQPIFIVQIAAAIIGLATFILLLPQFPSLGQAFGQVFDAIEQIAFPVVAGLTCFALFSTTLILTLRRYLLEK